MLTQNFLVLSINGLMKGNGVWELVDVSDEFDKHFPPLMHAIG